MHDDLNPDRPAEVPMEQRGPFNPPPTDLANTDLPGPDATSPLELEEVESFEDEPFAPEPAVRVKAPDPFDVSDLSDEFEDDEESIALADWKASLRHDFEQWLAAVDEIPDAAEGELPEAPDLYSFYEQLAAGTTESRKANRRTAEAFSQWGDTLAKFDGDLRLLREQLTRLPTAKDDALPRPWCLALAEILDRAHRLSAAFDAPPPDSWWGGSARWRKAWDAQRQGFDILVSHLEELLKKAGVTRLTTLRQPFDASTMAAVATELDAQLPHHTVTEEIAPGYRLNGELLRVAQVKISTNKT